MINDLKIGFTQQKKLRITAQFVEKFADLTGDRNPIHFDEKFAAKTIFKGRIVHGMISANLIATLLSESFLGAVYVTQTLHFLKPVRINDEIMAKFIVKRKIKKSQKIYLETWCENQKGERVLEGRAVIKILG